jgi:hypothetical protein
VSNAYRRRGHARALLLLGLERFREVGARTALVGSRGDDGVGAPLTAIWTNVQWRGTHGATTSSARGLGSEGVAPARGGACGRNLYYGDVGMFLI